MHLRWGGMRKAFPLACQELSFWVGYDNFISQVLLVNEKSDLQPKGIRRAMWSVSRIVGARICVNSCNRHSDIYQASRNAGTSKTPRDFSETSCFGGHSYPMPMQNHIHKSNDKSAVQVLLDAPLWPIPWTNSTLAQTSRHHKTTYVLTHL